jgi:hypothetical protein
MMETINGFGHPLAAGQSGKLRATAGVGVNVCAEEMKGKYHFKT